MIVYNYYYLLLEIIKGLEKRLNSLLDHQTMVDITGKPTNQPTNQLSLCMYVCMYVFIYACMYMYECMYVYM